MDGASSKAQKSLWVSLRPRVVGWQAPARRPETMKLGRQVYYAPSSHHTLYTAPAM